MAVAEVVAAAQAAEAAEAAAVIICDRTLGFFPHNDSRLYRYHVKSRSVWFCYRLARSRLSRPVRVTDIGALCVVMTLQNEIEREKMRMKNCLFFCFCSS